MVGYGIRFRDAHCRRQQSSWHPTNLQNRPTNKSDTFTDTFTQTICDSVHRPKLRAQVTIGIIVAYRARACSHKGEDMDDVESYVTVTLAIIGIFGVITALGIQLRAAACNRRMYRMMLTCGIDETTARNASQLLHIDMQDARRRCQRCPEPETCDRWLNGDAVPGNDFCPNASRFMAAAEASQCRVNYDLKRRPGRRLD